MSLNSIHRALNQSLGLALAARCILKELRGSFGIAWRASRALHFSASQAPHRLCGHRAGRQGRDNNASTVRYWGFLGGLLARRPCLANLDEEPNARSQASLGRRKARAGRSRTETRARSRTTALSRCQERSPDARRAPPDRPAAERKLPRPRCLLPQLVVFFSRAGRGGRIQR